MFTIKPFGNVLFIAVHGRSRLEGSVVLVVVWTVFFFFRIFDVKKCQNVRNGTVLTVVQRKTVCCFERR